MCAIMKILTHIDKPRYLEAIYLILLESHNHSSVSHVGEENHLLAEHLYRSQVKSLRGFLHNYSYQALRYHRVPLLITITRFYHLPHHHH